MHSSSVLAEKLIHFYYISNCIEIFAGKIIRTAASISRDFLSHKYFSSR
jgi:hypothetical protein